MCPNKEKILKTKKINGRSVSVIYNCFETNRYGRFETPNIWLNKTGCVFLEAYIGVQKRLHMSISTLPYGYVHTHLYRCVLQRRPLIVAERRLYGDGIPVTLRPKLAQPVSLLRLSVRPCTQEGLALE